VLLEAAPKSNQIHFIVIFLGFELVMFGCLSTIKFKFSEYTLLTERRISRDYKKMTADIKQISFALSQLYVFPQHIFFQRL